MAVTNPPRLWDLSEHFCCSPVPVSCSQMAKCSFWEMAILATASANIVLVLVWNTGLCYWFIYLSGIAWVANAWAAWRVGGHCIMWLIMWDGACLASPYFIQVSGSAHLKIHSAQQASCLHWLNFCCTEHALISLDVRMDIHPLFHSEQVRGAKSSECDGMSDGGACLRHFVVLSPFLFSFLLHVAAILYYATYPVAAMLWLWLIAFSQNVLIGPKCLAAPDWDSNPLWMSSDSIMWDFKYSVFTWLEY